MTDTEIYIFNTIKTCIWSGFYSLDDILVMMEDLIEDECFENDEACNEDALEQLAKEEWQNKMGQEKQWPEITDCDRLDLLFRQLTEQGIISIQNAGYDISEGIEYVSEILEEIGDEDLIGYCFYHEQDIERALENDVLFLAFGDLDDLDVQKIEVGKKIVEIIKKNGFDAKWDESPDSRIEIDPIKWQRRFDE